MTTLVGIGSKLSGKPPDLKKKMNSVRFRSRKHDLHACELVLNLVNENQVETARWLGFNTSALRPNWCLASDNCKNSKLGIDLDLPHNLQTEAENQDSD